MKSSSDLKRESEDLKKHWNTIPKGLNDFNKQMKDLDTRDVWTERIFCFILGFGFATGLYWISFVR